MSRFRQTQGDMAAVPSKGNSKYAIYATILIILAFVGYIGYTKFVGQSEVETQEVSQGDQISDQVAKIFEAPAGEVPSIEDASVVLSKLADKSILAGVLDTDKIVLYNNAKMLVVFRPSTGKIVTIVPLNTPAENNPQSQPQQGTSTAQTPEPAVVPLNIEVRNGTAESGAAGVLAKKLESEAGVKTVKTGNAANKNYKASVIVNLSGKDVSKLEASLGVKAITALPEGEKPSTADVLVIYGK